MADGIFKPCNVAWSWHWIRQVTAPCNVARGSGIMTVNSPSGSTMQCDTWLWDDMPLNSPGCRTLQCDTLGIMALIMTLIRQVATPCNVAGGSGMTCSLNSPKRPPYWNSTISPKSTCHSAPVCEILSKSDHPWQVGSNRHRSCKLLGFWQNRVFAFWRQDLKMADLRHLGFQRSRNGFYEKPMYNFL